MSSSSLPPREPSSRTPRPTDEDSPRRKRYSLIVEILDDDGFAVLGRQQQQQRDGIDRPPSRRLSRGTSTSRHRHHEGSLHQQHIPDATRQSRRMSTPSNAANIGSRDHVSERSRHAGTTTRSRTAHASEHGGEDDEEVYETAAEANHNRQHAVSSGQQQQQQQQQARQEDDDDDDTELHSPPRPPAQRRRRSSTHTSSTQTRIRGYGPRSVFTSPYNLFRPRHADPNDLDAMEAAYRDGLRLGQRLAGLPDPLLHAAHRVYHPRAAAAAAAAVADNGRQRREDPEQRGWRCLLPPWPFRHARRGPPAGEEVARSSSRARGLLR
ncbi:uncharacterized protein F4812DRAFT_464754 [Daldinia caldariorum]|uniref:uncharacterized protein n=1 Tax=Daldinia caldariorum TaxID=326644 RepID=UPI0020075748|nr:uncharacterized protein F4812DRAFT_464754 [Daldinia caldariorum]KAI1472714.1 hypothetical protein F4812DRAFT_464754 [Daldinia caldariorum]